MAASNDDNKQFRSRSTLCFFSAFFSSSSYSYFYTFRCTLICSVFAGAVAVVFNCTARIYLFLIIDRTFIIVFPSLLLLLSSFVFWLYDGDASGVPTATLMMARRSKGTQKCAQAKMNSGRKKFLNMQQFRSASRQ